MLTEDAKRRIPSEWHYMYERVWDEADYVVPPAENGAFFVMTNVVLTPNQTRSICPEDTFKDALCHPPPSTTTTTTTTTATTTNSSISSSSLEGNGSVFVTTMPVKSEEYFGDCEVF